MQKAGNITSTATPAGEFTNGVVPQGIVPTLIDAAWLNTIQRELVKVVEGSGLALNPADDTQVWQAIKLLANGQIEIAADADIVAGTAGKLIDAAGLLRRTDSGRQPPFNQAVCDAINGYPEGAILLSTDGQTLWKSTVDANTTDPDSGSTSGWVKVIDIATATDIQNGTAGKLVDAAGLKNAGRIAGEISYFAFQNPPSGWLTANGAAVSRTTYALLFSAIGTTYGSGNGSTTFNLPDLRGEFIRVWDNGRGVDPGRSFGSAQSDAIRNIVGRTDNLVTFSSGAVTNTGALAGSVNAQAYVGRTGSNSAGYFRDVTFDASLIVPVANENRPRNVALAAFIFAGA